MRNVVSAPDSYRRARGRHSRGSRPPRSAIVLMTASVVIVVVAAVLITLALQGPSTHPAAAGARSRPSRSSSASAPPGKSPAATVPHADPLGAAARSYLATRTGTIMAAVYDMGTGQTWGLGSGAPQDEASIVKLDILETLLAQHRPGGSGLTAQDQSLAQLMIEDSDNSAATSLWYAAGGARGIRSYNAALGLGHTTMSSCVNCPGFPWPGWGLSTTTAVDQISLLRAVLQANSQLTTADRRYALGLLENVTPSQRWGVSGGVPLRATVALKNGWLPLNDADTDWQINSIGWISGDGRSYLIAVLSTGNPSEQYGIDTIDGLAAIAWSRMR
jgi:Beta-lactamase enzyme family